VFMGHVLKPRRLLRHRVPAMFSPLIFSSLPLVR